jgi:hypothetical protein
LDGTLDDTDNVCGTVPCKLLKDMPMSITIKASDLYNKYPKDTERRHQQKFRGKPDPAAFNRDDLYEVIPMLERVMDELGADDACILHAIEEVMIRNMPGFIASREDVFDFLVGTMRDVLDDSC